MNWFDLKSQVKTFDLLFFQGQQIFGKIVRLILCLRLGKRAANFSHVGIVIRGSDFPKDHKYYSENKVYVWESTSSLKVIGDGIKNVDGKKTVGVQLRDMDDVIFGYHKKNPKHMGIYWAKLKDEKDINSKKLLEVFEEHNGKNYELNVFNVFAGLFPCLRPCRDRKYCCYKSDPNKYLFCSELAAVVYKQFDILGEDVESFNVVPSDFLQKDENQTFDEDNDIGLILETPIEILA